jgi:hypothetical protein
MSDARMPMPALVFRMPMPTYATNQLSLLLLKNWIQKVQPVFDKTINIKSQIFPAQHNYFCIFLRYTWAIS